MCGRFVVDVDEEDILALMRVERAVGDPLGRRYNIAPTQPVRIVAEHPRQPARQLRTARWGLVPSWATDPAIGNRMINARAETVADKPSFRSAAAKRRCLIPASGYYEWQRTPDGTQPYYLHGQVPLLAFAGLFEWWTPKDRGDAEPLWTTTIITTAASDSLGHLHDRTPVILPADLWDDWLAPTITQRSEVRALLDAAPPAHLTARPVGRAVGNVRNQGPGLLEPV